MEPEYKIFKSPKGHLALSFLEETYHNRHPEEGHHWRKEGKEEARDHHRPESTRARSTRINLNVQEAHWSAQVSLVRVGDSIQV